MHEEPVPNPGTVATRLRISAILIALFGGIAVLALKFYAARVSGSAALRSDALEGIVNVLAAAFGLGSVFFAEKPADRDHPYGHGKIEYFAQAFEGGLISFAGVLIVIDTGGRMIRHESIQELGIGIQISILAGIANGLMGLGTYWVGKKYHSQILVADGIHLLTDLLTSLVLTLGLWLALVTGWFWLDPLLALGMALFLFRTGFGLVQDSSRTLLDAEDPSMIQLIVDFLNRNRHAGVVSAHEVKVQKFGRDKHVDIHLVVPEFFTVKESHDIVETFSNHLSHELGHGSVAHTHADPCARFYCRECSQEPCPIRKHAFESRRIFTAQNITQREE